MIPKKSLTDSEKVLLVLASIKDDVVVTDFCNKHGIARSSLYTWRKVVLTNLASGLTSKKLHRSLE